MERIRPQGSLSYDWLIACGPAPMQSHPPPGSSTPIFTVFLSG